MSEHIDFVEFPTLRFEMGCNDNLDDPNDDEGPTRDVTVGRLRISRTPITVSQFGTFVDRTGFETVAEVEGSGFIGVFPDHELVEGATWRHPWGQSGPAAEPNAAVSQVAWTDAVAFCEWSGTQLPTEAQWARVAPNLGEELLPALGVSWEWCADYYDPTFHRGEQRVNPVGPHHGTERVARGGSRRRTARAHFYPDLSAGDVTFRVCA